MGRPWTESFVAMNGCTNQLQKEDLLQDGLGSNKHLFVRTSVQPIG